MHMCWRAVALVMLAFSQFSRAEAPSPAVPTEKENSGCLTWGFEDAFFRPLTGQGRVQWWISGVPDNFSSWLASVPAVSGHRMMFARVIANVSSSGRFGHLGMGSREIEISEILELRQFQQSDGVCQQESPPPPVPSPDSFRDQ
jgi:hypothetical protein